jgi:hypothetical protein
MLSEPIERTFVGASENVEDSTCHATALQSDRGIMISTAAL